jgi:hypothetical protein
MKIKKPHNVILSKKYPDKYFDWNTDEEFPYDEINKHSMWYKEEYDNNNNVLCRQYFNGKWYKYEYDNNGKLIYHESFRGYWAKFEYDEYGNQIYFENDDGYYSKREYNEAGKQIYYENSNGDIIDNRR